MPAFLWDAGAALLLFLLTVLFYWRILTPNPINRGSFPMGDFVEQFYAFASFRTSEILAGRLPLWNPYVYGGDPFIADIQSAVFYPLSWVTTLVAGPRGYPFQALEVEAIFHIFLAGFWMYLLASRVSGSRIGGLIGGMVYAFGGYLSAYPSQQLSVLEVHAWLPLVLFWVHLATENSLHQRSRALLFTVLGGVTLGVAILAGHPQASLYSVYASSLYFLFRLFAITGLRGWKRALRWLYLPAVLLITGFGVAAAQLLPTIEYMGISSRAQIPYDMSAWAFPLRDVLQIVLPGSVSYYSPMYAGVFSLALALAAVAWHRTRETGFWAALATAALLISFGGNTIIHSVLYNAVPGFGVFRHQERGIVLFSVAMGVLAAIGAKGLLDAGRDRVRRFAGYLLRGLLAAIAVFVLFYTFEIGAEKSSPVQNIAAFLVLVLALASLLLLLRLRGLGRMWLAGLVVALVAFDLISVSFKTNFEPTQPQDHYRPTEIQKYLMKNGANGRTHNDFQYPLNYGDVFKIRDVNGASPLVVERFKELFNAEPRERMWQLMNVKYFVTWQGGYPAEKISVEKTGDKEVNLYALPDPLPRAYVAHNAVVIPEDAAALRTVMSDSFVPGQQTVLDRQPAIAPSGAKKQDPATVTDITPDRLTIDTAITEPGILVLSEVYYPGWKATVDGQPAEILRAQYTLRGIALSAGTHHIEMVFDPLSVKAGMAVSAVFSLLAVVAIVALAIFSRRSAGDHSIPTS